jgi:hypothetical protein
MVNVNYRKDPAVYALHTGDHRYFYIGTTTVNSQNRLYQHISRANHNHQAPVYKRMRELGVRSVVVTDLQPLLPGDNALEVEARWISDMIERGFPLCNQVAVDGIPHSLSVEMRAKIGASRRGVPTWTKGKTGAEAGWSQERREGAIARASLARANRIPRHGTFNEYAIHGCRCESCFAAARNPRVPVEAHGRYLYKRDRCRCDICVTANRDYLRDWNSARSNN